jgi:NAD(P)-dependent dehydrogenase (short-subunit alcohol dehydrogenase family)
LSQPVPESRQHFRRFQPIVRESADLLCSAGPVALHRSAAARRARLGLDTEAAGSCGRISMGWLDDQVVLVTGGGSGIGRAVVARFVEEGARVGVMERVAARAEQLCAEFGDAVVGVSGDVSRIDDNRRAVAETVSAFGRLDVFVGNAGVFDVFASFTDLSDDKLNEACDELFGVNVKGCLFGAKAALPELRKTGGSMIFTASIAGLNSGGGGVLYTASKHAVVGMIRQLAAELGPDIRVNGVAPGGTLTDLRGLVSLGEDGRSQFANPGLAERIASGNPLRTALMPDDLAGAYVFLASRRNARGITGSIVTVDAGAMLGSFI